MWRVLEPRVRVGPPRPRPRVRLRPRGDRHHPQRLRGDGDPDLRHRPEARRRGRSSPTRTIPGCMTSWDQRARREGIVVKKISFPIPLPSPDVFVDRIREAITPRTRVIEFPQITNCSGQILPVREVVELGGRRGSRSSSTAPTPSPTSRSSATTWSATTSAPACTSGCWRRSAPGFLYVRKAKTRAIWPLMARRPAARRRHPQVRADRHAPGRQPQRDLARRWRSTASIGAERKLARLRYLRDRWAKALLGRRPARQALDPARRRRGLGRHRPWCR